MDKIPTIEDYLKQRLYITKDDSEDVHDSLSNVCDAVKGIIQLHITAALKAASENVETTYDSANNVICDEKSILNAYSLDEIK